MRLPDKVTYNWDQSLENEFKMNDYELLLSILFVRLKNCEVERQKWILSGIKYLLENDKTNMIKPIKWFIKNKDRFLEISFILVLQLLDEFIHEYDLNYRKYFEEDLRILYPSENFTLNHLLRRILDYKIEYNTQVYISPNRKSIDNDLFEYLIKLYKSNYFLNLIGVDLQDLIESYYYDVSNSKFQKNISDNYHNRHYNILIPNIHHSNVMQKHINRYIQKYFTISHNLQGFSKEEIYDNISYDIKTLIAQQNSLITRPHYIKKPFDYDEILDMDNNLYEDDGWIKIAYCEKQRILKNNNSKDKGSFEILLFQGVVFTKDDIDFPFFKFPLNTKTIWENHKIINDLNILEDIIIIADSFLIHDFLEDSRILWILPKIFSILNLKMRTPSLGLRAYNDTEDDILIFNKWNSDYIGNKEFEDEIPRLIGSELLIRIDYFDEICKLFNYRPHFVTKKIIK
jgi:hypothetical protein